METPTKRRKTEIQHSFRKNEDDLPTDSGEDLFQIYDTVATLPLPGNTQDHTHIHTRTSNSASEGFTQPTQILNARTPASDHCFKPSVVQVAASSPIAEPTAQSPSPALKKAGVSLASRMAPPGTAFRSPVVVREPKPVVDLSSDDDACPIYQREVSDEESQLNQMADIKPSKFIQSIQNDSSTANSIRFKEITSQSFYKPIDNSQQAQASKTSLLGSSMNQFRRTSILGSNAAKRSADVMADAYGNTSRPTKARQVAPPKMQQRPDITLDEIEDYQIRSKVERMHGIFPATTFATCKAALLRKKGNYDDAMDYLFNLAEAGATIDLTSSDHEQSSHQKSNTVRSAAKQQLKAPAKSIQSKWTSTQVFSQQAQPPSSSSPTAPAPKARKRLVQGLKNSPSPAISRKSSPAGRDMSAPVDLDSETDSALGPEPDEQNIECKVLGFLSTCTTDQLADIAAITETVASTILSKKPFKNLDAVRRISGDSKQNAERKSTRPIGDKIVNTCLDMWRGYDAVDGLVLHCESVGKPVAEQIKKWGVDVYGTTNDGELDLVTFDHLSEMSMRDSGIGTPTSGPASPDADSEVKIALPKDKRAIFGQPRLMPEHVVLKDYQIVGVNWLALLFEKKLSCILADDMGLGKTCQVIAFLAHLFETGNQGPHLVVVPGSTIENWLREFSVFCPKLSVAGQTERTNIRYQIETNLNDINVIVTTYGVAKAKDDCRFLRKLPLQVCVYDEGHQLKNRKSTAYEQLMRLSSEFRLLLTGTPLQNNLTELVSLLAFIMPEIFREHSEHLDFVFSQKAKTNNEGHAALLSAQRIGRARSMMAPFVLRRKKHQVLKYLPQKRRRVEWCELSPTQREVYIGEKARGLQVIADRAAGKKVGNETANVMMSLRKASIHPLLFRRVYDNKMLLKMAGDCLKEAEFKDSQYELCLEDMGVMMDFELQRFCERYPSTMSKYRLRNDEWMDSGKVTRLAELLQEYKRNGDRVLVFSQFVMVMDILEDVMETLGMRFFRLDGQTKIDERQDMIDQFHADTDITVFLLSTKAGGAGINLACANKVVIFDSSFNPQDDIQAENRAHRVGQTREVEVVRLVTKGTIEEQIHALGQTKLALDDRVAGADEATVMAVDDEKQAERLGQQAVEEMLIKELEADQDKK
ncbi:MAG: hypothetical protein LQ345_000590 [Seirophora villosa]|nr:MAG: hypothetical protein LQ345_000590 [Seirophora villosa]